MDRDLVHRQTAAVTVKHLALGCAGLGCEDAITHLLNYTWPNVFETSPHLINAVSEAIDGARVALQLTPGLFHMAALWPDASDEARAQLGRLGAFTRNTLTSAQAAARAARLEPDPA